MKRLLFLSLVLTLFVQACNDKIVDPAKEPPAFPDVSLVLPDLSYFDIQTGYTSKTENTNYSKAKGYIMVMSQVYLLAKDQSSWFSNLDYDNWKYDNDKWVWEHESEADENGFQIMPFKLRVTAQESDNGIIWEMYITYVYESGSFTQKMLGGTVALDGKTGEMHFYQAEYRDNEPLLTSNWNFENDSKGEVNLIINFLDKESQMKYLKDGVQNFILITDPENNVDVSIFWNDETKAGGFQFGEDENTLQCWDSSFQDVDCETVTF